MSEDVRPFEEYKEMIKDMRREEMIKGLYDLSARITKQDKEIERLNKYIKDDKENADEIIAEQQREIERLHSIIKEVKKYLDIDESIRKTCKRYDVNGIAILEILDKVDKEK